jgi:tetratricopeptide (TPR) repeat protein
MVSRKLFFIIAGICIFFLSACGPKAVAPEAEFDTPAHHVNNGHKLLKSGKIDAAFREFNRAKELDPKHSPAYVGLGLVQGVKGEFDNGFKAMKKAQRYADGKEQKVAVNVGYMRLYIMGGEKVKKNWLQEVTTRFNNAIGYIPDLPEPYFYMGIAYKNSYKFQKAAANFTKVLELDKGLVAEADKEYAIVQKIQRAMPGSVVGKKIALLEKITRADAAALFIEELEIDTLFKKRTPKKYDTAFQDPTKKFAAGEYVKTPPATDIENHVLKADIDAVIAIGIKGLQPGPDHTFQPDKTITRAEFAMMIEDILIKITGDNGLATKFIGNASPFPDLRNDLPFFNAAMVCTTRNILETKDVATGEFAPMEPVAGAEALLSIRALKTQL